MIENLRAKPVKEKDLKDNIFELKNNTPMQINKENNLHVAHIHEENEDEDCFIYSQFCDKSFAMICKEFYLNFQKNPKRVDFSYYYFSEDNTAIVYLYDMKKTLAGNDVIFHLIEQWKSSICDAKYCVKKTEYHKLEDFNIHIGVITENNDTERRKNELQSILYPESLPDVLPSFVKSQHMADTADQIAKAKILSDFDKGKVTIDGFTYYYDVRTFVAKKHNMYFNNGLLEQQIVV